MSYHDSSSAAKPYKDPTPLPDDIPKVQEVGATSAPLKSAAFFLGAYCKEFNGMLLQVATNGMADEHV
jgi:NADH dehydrogenase (ubiquinone) 1 alpha subcomplex subunit 8